MSDDTSVLLRPSLNALRQQVARELSEQAAAESAPLVCWSGIGEAPEQFAPRIARLRAAWTGRILCCIPHGYVTPDEIERVKLPARLHRLLHPMRPSRYRCASGGRGSAKSHSIATAIVLHAISRRLRILCAREIMRSLRESVHHLLCEKIEALRLGAYFEVTDREIRCHATGSQIIFSGLYAHISTLKSLENIGLVWIEEAESASAPSLEVLTPTVRAPDSEIWLSANPTDPVAPVQQFIEGKRPDTLHDHVIFSDNPFFPPSLEGERAYLQRVDDDSYRHIWLGECRTVSDALIFEGKFVVEDFEPQPKWSTYCGLDFGHSVDPCAAVLAHVNDCTLYISREFWALRVELDQLSALIEAAIPGSRRLRMHCDCSRPESISFLQRHGHPNAAAAPKWSGSIVEGITFLRSFERIVVAPSCQHTIDELRSYSYRVDRLTNLPTTEPEDKNNHLLDSLRYALSDLVKQSNAGLGIFNWYGGVAAKLESAKAQPAAPVEAAAPAAAKPAAEAPAAAAAIEPKKEPTARELITKQYLQRFGSRSGRLL